MECRVVQLSWWIKRAVPLVSSGARKKTKHSNIREDLSIK